MTQEQIIQKLKNELDDDTDYRRVEFVGPKVGKELKSIAIKAVLFSLIAMFIYIWFSWQYIRNIFTNHRSSFFGRFLTLWHL